MHPLYQKDYDLLCTHQSGWLAKRTQYIPYLQSVKFVKTLDILQEWKTDEKLLLKENPKIANWEIESTATDF